MSGNMKNKTRLGVAAPKRVKDTRAHCRAATLSDTQFITATPGGQRSISELLGIGAENGMTNEQLSRLTGIDKRTIQSLISAERLRGVPMCLLRSDDLWGYNDYLMKECRRSGFEPNVPCQCYDTPMAMQLVRSGFGLSLIHI